MNSLTLGMIHSCIITRKVQDNRLFFSSGSKVFTIGNTITGAESKATGILKTLVLVSGAWEQGDAAGYLILSSVSGSFQDRETLSEVVDPEEEFGSALASGTAIPETDELGTPQYTEISTAYLCRFETLSESIIQGGSISGDFVSAEPMVFLPGTVDIQEGDVVTSLEPYFNRHYKVTSVNRLFDFYTHEVDHVEALLKTIEKKD